MRPNLLREKLARHEIVTMASCATASPYAAECLGHAGFDAVMVDMQHGAADDGSQLVLLTAISATPAVPLVRVRWNEPGAIMRALDSGAYGVVAPMVNSRADCEALVRACYYHPQGERSWGPMRALLYGGPDYFVQANRTILPIAMVETRQALESVEDIASVPGLGALLIGPNDLAISLGFGPQVNLREAPLRDAYLRICEAGKRHGVPVASYCADADEARAAVQLGVRIAWIGSDATYIRASGKRLLDQFHHPESTS